MMLGSGKVFWFLKFFNNQHGIVKEKVFEFYLNIKFYI